jgi:hypothetical protein
MSAARQRRNRCPVCTLFKQIYKFRHERDSDVTRAHGPRKFFVERVEADRQNAEYPMRMNNTGEDLKGKRPGEQFFTPFLEGIDFEVVTTSLFGREE